MKRRLIRYCFLLSVPFSVFILSANSLSAQVQFERHTIDGDLAGAYWVYAVDMDGDRDSDLVTASNRGIDLWRNRSGSFTRSSIGSFQGAWAAHAADVDLDGDVDAMGASSGVDEFAFWEKTGSGFSKITLGEILGPESIHAADLDADGDLDIIGASWSEDHILWWQNNGNGRFSQKVLDNLNNAHSVYAADLDNDGRVDGIACGVEGTRWYRNDGDGNFTDRRISSDGGWCVFAADVDGDGDNDVLRTQRNNGDVVLFRNSGGGSFSKQIIEPGYGECWSVVAGDVDGDGDMDIAAAGFGANNIMVWFNKGNGNFSEGVIVDNVDTARGVYIADVDKDGDGDIAAAIRGDKDLAWYEVKASSTASKNITVTVPDGGETLVAESEFRIEWDSSGDIDEVEIEYSVDAGNNWTTVENRTDNDGHYNWTVPNTPTFDALIRISDADDGATRDVSGATFEIEEPPKTIVVGLPNGGEKLFAGTEFRIEWDSTGNIDDVNIEYSLDSGGNWTTIQRDAFNGGTYKWQVPSATTEEGLIRIVDTNSNSINDQSDEPFAIAQPTLSFTDITLSAGTGGPENDTGGHAALFADVDGDNLPDLYFTMLFNDPMSDLFFRNTGGNSFVNEASLRGVADFDGGSHGGAFADLDNDGDFDLYNGTTFGTNDISGVNNIFQNDGNGFFVDVTSISGIPEREWPTRAALAFDMDKDGDLDLLAITNFAGSDDPPDERNEIYRNDGNMQFTAINAGELYSAPAGQGATDTDYDGDGDIDIIAANRTGDVNILQNDGSGNFTLIPPASIGVNHGANDGITTGDVDNDGDLDMLLAEADIGNLYRNNGDGTFSFIMSFSGTDGYMGAFADLDNDADLDLVFAGDTECYLNDGNGFFSPGPAIPVDGINDPRAVAFADIDLDGDLDFAFGCKRSRNWLVRNNYDSGNWLKINLVSPQGQTGAFGAKARIYPPGEAGGALLGMRESRSNNGYLGQSDPVLHFGLGSYSSVDVVVRFLNGTTITRSHVSANQTITVDLSGTAPQTPNITAFVPISGPVGTEVTMVGSNFNGATDVSFGGVSSPSFAADSDGQIRAEVPVGAQTGRIAIT
ncbi:hypothetical protein GWO43_15375, partial [candidate division KSB1 bacterium]|nr:hypothetical protein [candidate division KSB1 bacterium]NIR68371.1 hypothetical protein [candidate division KSB1 bacterium]NIS25315.1 hypothetical protein [candidate division KSB1 bacterium]NIT72226.1 hypothetical protein [candidate division KSB1 bacterium]NIU26034.1 hypothetical protein [candidate division KSB1 bacterium]